MRHGLLHAPQRRAPADLDALLLEACGPWGGTVDDTEAAAILEIYVRELVLSGRVAPDDAKLYASLMARTWTPSALTHVFCGEPTPYGLGGMHWSPRWVATKPHWRVDPGCSTGEAGPVQKVGVVYQVAGSRAVNAACPKSHAPRARAQDLLEAGLAGVKAAMPRCFVRHEDGFVLVVLQDGGVIKTVYPRRTADRDVPCSRPRSWE